MKKPNNALKERRQMNSNTLLLVITIALFVVMYAGGCIIYADKGFPHLQTFLNILINNTGLICLACGLTCVMLTGGIDISVGALIAMICMFLAVGMDRWHMGAVPLVILVLVIGVVFGMVQGFLLGYLDIQPFIVSMAGMFFARGMTAVICTEQVSVPSDSLFYQWANFKINIPFGGYANKKGIYQVPYIRIGVVIALVVGGHFPGAAVYQVRTQPLRRGRQ
jgi:simple sugar transport system permease protein